MRSKRLQTMVLVALCFLLPALAYGAEPVKVGDITAFTGEVLARTKGVWAKVASAPHPIYSDDKVVTRRGRAEIGFVDGGMMRLNLDSNISIEKTEGTTGFAFKNKVAARQVNILVGEVWFEVKVEKGQEFKVRTPAMTAAVRGSSATIKQDIDPNEPAEYAFIEGDIATDGSYENVPPKAIGLEDVRTNAADLPSSNPAVDSSPAQQAAVDAAESRSKASEAASRAGEDSETAQAAGDQAAKSQATDDKLAAAAKKAEANESMGEAAVLDRQAQMLAEQEKLLEAQSFRETEEVSAIQSAIGQLGQEIAKIEAVAEELAKAAEAVEQAVQSGDLQSAEQALQQSETLIIEVPVVVPLTTDTTTTETTTTTEELAYTEETTTEETTTTTTTPPPDTQDLGTSSPAQ